MPPSHRFLTSLLAACLGLLPVTGSARAESECWTRFYGDPGSVITDMATNKQGLWVAGRLEEPGASPVLWLALLDWQGRTEWQTKLPPKGYQLYPRLAPARQGMWVVAETTLPMVPAEGGGFLTASETWLGQVGPDGKLGLQTHLSTHRVQTVQAAAALANGGILLAGLAETDTSLQSQGWLAGLDADGKLLWQRLLPEVSWLSGLAWRDINSWLIAGQLAGDQSDAPWLGAIDHMGRVRQSWTPAISGLSVYAVLSGPEATWLAGESTPPGSGARLVRFDPGNGRIDEYPAAGFSVLRLLTQEPGGLLAGGDGIAEAAPDAPAGSPGWLTLPAPDQPPYAQRLPSLYQGELRAWTYFFHDRNSAEFRLMGAGASQYQGAWVGCIKPERIDPTIAMPDGGLGRK